MSTEPCPHCHTKAKHGERIGCCSGCGELFASMSAFDRHRKALTCLTPQDAGLVAKHPQTDPDATMWALPGSWTPPEPPEPCGHRCSCTSDDECPHECPCGGA